MSKHPFLFSLCLLALTALSARAAEVRFVEGDLEVVRAKAVREGKMLFVHFTADWCLPCRWMEKETYHDQALADFLNDKFIALKVDIDKAENYNVKNAYQVVLLPSMLVFDRRGELRARYEESLPAQGLLSRLKSIAPGDILVAEPAPDAPFFSPPAREEVVDNPFPSIGTERPDPFSGPRISADSVPAAQPKEPAPEISEKEEEMANPESFAIQLGVYSDFENAEREAQRIKNLLDLEVVVTPGQLGEKSIYRVLVGKFPGFTDAEKFRRELSTRYDMEGVVKNLARLSPTGSG